MSNKSVVSRTTRLAITIGLALVICGCSNPGPSGPAISPGQVFPGDKLNVTWPNSEGWHLSSSRHNEWIFAKQGSQADDTYIALITWVELPPGMTPSAFAAFVKKSTDADTDLNRFKDVQSTVEFSRERKYPCVQYRAFAKDSAPRTASGQSSPLLLEMEDLACQNPLLDGVAFVASYSHRGPKPAPRFHEEAAEFFGGIQVPGY